MPAWIRRFTPPRFSLSVALALLTSLAPLPGQAQDKHPMAERTQACTACHGDQGKAGPDGYYPRLAGKPAGYLFNQLMNFAEGRRHYALMNGLIAPLSPEYLHDMADYFASLDVPYPPPAAATAPAAVLQRGKSLVLQGDRALGIPACVQCHGTALTGVLPATPGLLGLPRDYLNAQLGGWQTGQRKARAPDCMAEVARKLSSTDVNAVTQWLAAQAVPVPAKPATARPAAAASGPTLPTCSPTP
ncbi:c-type cytochrome [Rhodoferax saidenbachensis]|uniref:Cytochrome c553 n=1 Tax=Rhodoferax saidenbachensis TaxID=1484693 RepID=A0ABU1ZT38_9BURK|nr:cytochrome c553 [Rhodoferax saidenbachensis]